MNKTKIHFNPKVKRSNHAACCKGGLRVYVHNTAYRSLPQREFPQYGHFVFPHHSNSAELRESYNLGGNKVTSNKRTMSEVGLFFKIVIISRVIHFLNSECASYFLQANFVVGFLYLVLQGHTMGNLTGRQYYATREQHSRTL